MTFLASGPRSLSSTSKLTLSPFSRVLNPCILMEEWGTKKSFFIAEPLYCSFCQSYYLLHQVNCFDYFMVGTTGFEPATPASRTLCSTRLSHVPTLKNNYFNNFNMSINKKDFSPIWFEKRVDWR